MHVSKQVPFWENVINAFYDKYNGIHRYHDKIIFTALRFGEIENPISGRRHVFQKYMRKGELQYSENDIVNYPVQSLGSDIMAVIRTTIRRNLKREGLLNKYVFPVLTVHDSVIYDVVDDVVIIRKVAEIIEDAFCNAQHYWEERYGFRLKVPHSCEIKMGKDWGNLETIYKDGKWTTVLS